MSSISRRLRDEYEEESYGDSYADWNYANDDSTYADTRLMQNCYARNGSVYKRSRDE